METGRLKETIVDSRINKVLAMRTDSVAMLESLDAISEFYGSNTVDARRMLRQDLELQNINLAKKFLLEFELVKERIDEVEYISNKLQVACISLASKVKDADENMKSFMEKASQLENRKIFYETQSTEIKSFLSRFQLSNGEIHLLYYADINNSEVANAFFEALQRLKSAFHDCKLMVEKHCYSVGFELLELLGQHQDMAYQHLFEWVKGKCDVLSETTDHTSLDDSDINMRSVQTAIRFLKSLPIYFDQCQDLLVNSRRTQLVQRFVVALTQGDSTISASSSSTTSSSNLTIGRALDLHAHDAVRYVGGMLAWMHQAIASELEFLEAIFGENDVINNRNNSIINDNENNSSDEIKKNIGLSIPELLARCLQGLGRPLRVRILQTLETKTGLDILYALTDLFSFYQETFHKILPIENAVHSAVKGCLIECKRLFITALNKQGEYLTQSPVTYPIDLKASHTTRECASQIKEILRVCSNSLSKITMDTTEQCHIDSVLGIIIQPLLQSCRLGAQSLQPAEMAIFMLNNVSVLQYEILEASKRSNQSYRSLSWLSLLETESSTWIGILVDEEVSRTLKRSDLDKLLELIEVVPIELKAIEQTGLSNDRVSTVMRSFYASLFSTISTQFEKVQDPTLKEVLRLSTAEKLASAHAKIHTFISMEKNGFDLSILAHTIDEVKVILGCGMLSNNL